jgi:hypothetical protein
VITLISGVYGPLQVFFLVLAVVAFGLEAWALGDAIYRPGQAYLAAGKLTKVKWLFILAPAFALGLAGVFYLGVTNFLSVIAFVAAAVYLSDVRPRVKEFKGRGGNSSHMGPYGPW